MVERIKAQVAAEHDEVSDARRPLRRRHRAARVAPHRQPAARSVRPSGRPGRVPVLPVARGRADAAVQVRLGRPGAHHAEDPRRRPDREQAGHQRDRQRPGPGRVAELRVPQERPQVRRRDEPPARGHLRRAPRGARGRRPEEQIRGFIDDTVDGYVSGATEGFAEEWDLDGAVDRAQASSTRSAVDQEQLDRGGRRRRAASTARSSSRTSRRTPTRRTTAREEELGEEVMRELERRVLLSRARPQVARAPLRDGLPARGHRPAGLLPARPAGRVPARGLRHVRRDDGRHQGGVGRLPLQPRGPGRGRRGRRGAEVEPRSRPSRRSLAQAAAARRGSPPGRSARAARSAPRASRAPTRPQNLSYSRAHRGRRGRGHAEAAAPTTTSSPASAATRKCPCGSGKKYKRCHGAPGGATGSPRAPAADGLLNPS